jgi:uncharacterized damage-inducible protein DinB
MATVQTAVEDWERSKLGAQDYLDAMPESGYAASPAPECLSCAGQFLHLAHANYMFAAALGAESPLKDEHAEKNPDLQSRSAASDYTLASYDFMIEAIKTLDPATLGDQVKLFRWEMPREAVLTKAYEHQIHHRGQAAIYLRLQGIKPPGERLF